MDEVKLHIVMEKINLLMGSSMVESLLSRLAEIMMLLRGERDKECGLAMSGTGDIKKPCRIEQRLRCNVQVYFTFSSTL